MVKQFADSRLERKGSDSFDMSWGYIEQRMIEQRMIEVRQEKRKASEQIFRFCKRSGGS